MSIPSGKPAHDTNPLDRLDEIQARADKATDGPWWHSSELEHHETAHYVRSGGEHLAVFTGNYSGASEDGEFIAHARTDVPALVAALRGVKKLLAEYEKDDQDHLRSFGQHHPYAGWAADHLRVALGEAQP